MHQFVTSPRDKTRCRPMAPEMAWLPTCALWAPPAHAWSNSTNRSPGSDMGMAVWAGPASAQGSRRIGSSASRSTATVPAVTPIERGAAVALGCWEGRSASYSVSDPMGWDYGSGRVGRQPADRQRQGRALHDCFPCRTCTVRDRRPGQGVYVALRGQVKQFSSPQPL